jgi:DNA-binding NtrC family response regulator
VEEPLNYRVLIADDKQHVLDNFRNKLINHLDIEPVFTQEATEVIKLIQEDPYEYAVVLIDYHFEGQSLNGAQVAEEILKINPKLIVLVCTGDMGREAPISCLRAGVSDFIQKDEPLDQVIERIRFNCKKFDELSRVITPKASKNKKQRENSALIKKIGMIGWSDSMAEIASQILSLSENGGDRSTILIRGESGTGKELLAKAIHNTSSRKSQPFISLNCAAIPTGLLESELFGHEKGAFTGADRKRLGKFQAATGGTIFLDEIGEMDKALQAKLLRVLQEKTIEPVGSNKALSVDVRVIAATHADLEEKIENGDFREDLFYRLNHIPINVPALRERKEDIVPLVTHFIDKHPSHPKKRLMFKTLQYLRAYEWNGNIRELENIINRLLILTPGEEIRPEHLDAKLFNSNKTASTYSQFKDSLKKEMEEKEKEFLLEKIRAYPSLRAAAKALAIPNTSLQRKLNEWGYTQEGERAISC